MSPSVATLPGSPGLLPAASRRRLGKPTAGLGLALAGCLLWFALTLLGRHYLLTLVVGESMLPTLRSGSLLLVDRRAYAARDPGRGDIVVIRHRGEQLVKRVVGLPGEEVELVAGRLHVNGIPLPETYPRTPGTLEVGRGLLGPGKFAVVGDNRSGSGERLIHGVFSREQILGKAILSESPGSTDRSPDTSVPP